MEPPQPQRHATTPPTCRLSLHLTGTKLRAGALLGRRSAGVVPLVFVIERSDCPARSVCPGRSAGEGICVNTSGEAQAGRRLLGCAIGPVAGVVAAWFGTGLVQQAWIDCNIGINMSANFWSLLPLFFGLWLATTLVWAFAFGFLGARSWPTAILAALIGTLGLYWILMAGWGAPSGYPVDVAACMPDNTPPWWPRWLPL
ncbi:hypothetical protein [Streptomyces sp. NPDC056227]|uniref:hypothetical protein n=1 Tax=Streptomyces sp. NPDC056227 TaxID=3345753 RepID=UPI0035D79A37